MATVYEYMVARDGGAWVLLPTGHDASTYRCLRSLHRRGVRAIVASDKDGVPAAASRFCGESVSLPDPRSDLLAYRDSLLALAARKDVRTIIPVRPEDSYVLSRFRDAFEEHVSLVVPSMPQLESVYDRLRLAEAAEAAGVPVPETRLLSTVDSWNGELLIKTRYNVLVDAFLDGVTENELRVVKDIHHVGHDLPPDADAIRRAMGHDPIVQEFVHKDGEYLFAALYEDGDPLATFQHEQLRGNSYTGGGGVYRRSIHDPDLEAVGTRLLDHLDWHGLACIEYMKDARTDEYVLTEVNPRMWQSLPSAIHAGADFPYYYWLAATGRADEIECEYQLGVGTHMFRGELGYLASVLTERSPHLEAPGLAPTVWEIASSIVREPHFDYLSLDDPRPFLAGVRNVLRGRARKSRFTPWSRTPGR